MKNMTFLRSMLVFSALLITGLGYAQVKNAVLQRSTVSYEINTRPLKQLTGNAVKPSSGKKLSASRAVGRQELSLVKETFGTMNLPDGTMDAMNYFESGGFDNNGYINYLKGTIATKAGVSDNYMILPAATGDGKINGYIGFYNADLKKNYSHVYLKFDMATETLNDSLKVAVFFINDNGEIFWQGTANVTPSASAGEFHSYVLEITNVISSETAGIVIGNVLPASATWIDNIEVTVFEMVAPDPDFSSYAVAPNSEPLFFYHSPDYPWAARIDTIDGQYQLRGVESTNQGALGSTSFFGMNVYSADAVDLSYAWKVNAGSVNDKLTLYVNGTEHASISGDTPLKTETFRFDPGEYNFQWAYVKPVESGSTGDDKGFVTNIKVGYASMVASTELFKETFGTADVSTKPKIEAYTGYDNSAAGVTYTAVNTSSGDIRTLASDTIHKTHLWLPAKSNSGIVIGGLESFVSGHTNLRLSFEAAVQSSTTLALNIVANGTEVIQFPETVFTEYNKYQTIKCSAYLPADLSTLQLSVSEDMATVGYRIDNITITEEKSDDTPDVSAPVLQVDKSLINFKYVSTPNQGNERVYISNVGKEDLVISEIKGVSAPFSYTALASENLPQYMGNEMYFQFTPAATDKGVFRQTATIVSNGGEQEIVLQGYANMNNVVETADYDQLSTVVTDTSVDSLIVIGYLNDADFEFIRYHMNNLRYLDVSGTEIMAQNNTINTLPMNALESTFLEKVLLPESLIAIGGRAFSGCSSLREVNLPSNLLKIGAYAFQNCSLLKEINLPEGLIYIYENAFRYCSSLTGELILPSTLTNIEYDAFNGCGYTVCRSKAVIPPSLDDKNSFANISLVYVPKGSAQAYRQSYSWSEMTIIDGDSLAEVSVTLTEAGTLGAEILKQAESVAVVNKLIVAGPMNTDDWNLIKNSMSALLSIDLSACTATGIPNSQFSGKISLREIVLPTGLLTIEGDAFYNCSKLTEIVIPETVTTIGYRSFNSCSLLKSINIPINLKSLGAEAFGGCYALQSPMVIPEGITEIPSSAFYHCRALTEVILPESLVKIGYNAFYNCSISTIVLPEQLKTIENEAFSGCPLQEIILPAALTTIESGAFGCSLLTKITCKQATPPALSSDPFSNVDKNACELSVPAWSVDMYKLAKYWMNFSNITTYDAEVDYLPVSGVLTMADGVRPQGTPSVTVQKGAALIVCGEQPFATNKFVMKHKLYNSWGTDFSSCTFANLLNESPEMTTESATMNFEVNGNKWFFLSFPYDINYSGITVDEGKFFVFRKYDGASRANKGVSTITGDSWKNMESSEVLKAGNGYIFQCNEAVKNLTLKATIESKNQLFANTMRSIALNDYIPVDGNTENQSWNLVGNPFPSYFDINGLEYVTPITIWNGSSYEALSPVDDEYVLRPFEAFFVQKPTDVASIKFNPNGRRYKTSSSNKVAPKQVAANSERQVFNFIISNENSEDKCRIVINPKAKADYEMTCDAAKFMSLEADVPQIYTIDRKGTMFAINERLEGNVLMGMYVAKAGDYTISLRTQVEGVDVFLLDRTTGEETNLSSQDYTFAASEGVNNDRFEVRFEYAGPTNIDSDKAVTVQVNSMKGALHVQAAAGSVVEVVNYTGLTVKNMTMAGSAAVISLPQGAYVVIVNGKSYKAIVL